MFWGSFLSIFWNVKRQENLNAKEKLYLCNTLIYSGLQLFLKKSANFVGSYFPLEFSKIKEQAFFSIKDVSFTFAESETYFHVTCCNIVRNKGKKTPPHPCWCGFATQNFSTFCIQAFMLNANLFHSLPKVKPKQHTTCHTHIFYTSWTFHTIHNTFTDTSPNIPHKCPKMPENGTLTAFYARGGHSHYTLV